MYRGVLTWVKPSLGLGNDFRGTTEHVLFGVRGKLKLRSTDIALPTCRYRRRRSTLVPSALRYSRLPPAAFRNRLNRQDQARQSGTGRYRQARACGGEMRLAMADKRVGAYCRITQIRLCCVAGAVPVMNRPGAKRSRRRWRVERSEGPAAKRRPSPTSAICVASPQLGTGFQERRWFAPAALHLKEATWRLLSLSSRIVHSFPSHALGPGRRPEKPIGD
jgi:hypothetical protein